MSRQLTIYTPIYNSEPFLDRLLASMSELPSDRVELLFVDDCSSDKSVEILQAYCADHGNARLLKNEKNSGVGATSNKAIDAVTTPYLQRCDSDDELIAEGMLEALDIISAANHDLVIEPHQQLVAPGEWKLTRPKPLPEDGNILRSFWRFDGWRSNLWTTMIRSDFVKELGVRFVENRDLMGEDTIYISELLVGIDAKRIKISDTPSYKYHRREGSISQPPKRNRESNAKYAHELLVQQDFMETLGHRFVAEGHLDKADVSHALSTRCASILKPLRKSGQHARVIAEYHRVREKYGATKRMRLQYLKSLPLGIWRMLLP